jgi:hypothetical protein
VANYGSNTVSVLLNNAAFPTSVEQTSFTTQVPKTFELAQNYPNPFNPSTTFSFSVPSKSFVSLKILDVLGREVSSVISEELPAGTYWRRWNAGHLTSGIYFFRLKTGNYVETKKLILLK